MDIELGLEMQANTQLKKENRLLKSLLYCTTRSCNNCGKVNCENFQRQRIDCCGHWVSYKDYIKQLETQIEKMKCCGNCKYYKFQNDAGYYTCTRDGKRNGKNYRSCEFNLEKWEGR